MNIIIREGEFLTNNKYYKGRKNYHYFEDEYYDIIYKYISKYINKVEGITRLNNKSSVIKTNRLVGKINVNKNLSIIIVPKIFEDNCEEKIEIIESMAQEINEAEPSYIIKNNIFRGLIKKSIIEEYISAVFEIINNKLSCDYVEVYNKKNKRTLDENTPENKLIKSCLLKLKSIAISLEEIKNINYLLEYFKYVDISTNYYEDFKNVNIKSDREDYLKVINLSKLLLFDLRINNSIYFEDEQKSFLYRMDKLFEHYISFKLKKISKELNLNLYCQCRGKYLFDNPKCHEIIPDAIITKHNKNIVLDIKCKKLDCNKDNRLKIAQKDVFQIYVYANKYNTNQGILIYPYWKGLSKVNDLEYKAKYGVNVRVIFINLENLEKFEEDFKGVLVDFFK